MRIGICDDESRERERAENFLEECLQGSPYQGAVVTSFSDPLELLSHVREQGEFDILLLDVYMHGMLGTEVARELRQLGYSGEILFLTTSRDHALDAFDVGAALYLNKPCTQSAFHAALSKVLDRVDGAQHHKVKLETGAGEVQFFARDVVFSEESRNHVQLVHTVQGEQLEVRMTAGTLFSLLAPSGLFVKCGDTVNLNLKHVRQIRKNAILLDSGVELAYPHRSYHMLKERFLRFHMESDE